MINKNYTKRFRFITLVYCSLPIHCFLVSILKIFSEIHFFLFVFGLAFSTSLVLIGVWSLFWYASTTMGLKASTIYLTSDFLSIVVYDLLLMVIGFAGFYAFVGIMDAQGNLVDDFLTCLYFSIVTFTTLGYGDFRPTEATRAIAAIEAIVGFIMFAYIIGTAVSIGRVTLKDKEIQKVGN